MNKYKQLSLLISIIVVVILSSVVIFDLKLTTLALHNNANPTPKNTRTFDLQISQLLNSSKNDNYEKVLNTRPFIFPKDHGPHPTFRNEWWYITGNLFDQFNDRYGFQLTFFRRVLSPSTTLEGWQNNTITMAHFAVSNHKTGRFIAREKFGRDGAAVAGAQSEPFRVWLDDWQIQSVAKKEDSFFPLKLQAQNELLSLDLELDAQKPITLQGDQGMSQKSEHPEHASYYYSFTRLNALGTLTYKQKQFEVKGLSWLDREWSTSALSKNQQGWDWFALQLNNGDDIMYYRIRNQDNTTNTYSGGIVVTNDNRKIRLGTKHVILTPLQNWTASDGQIYPVKWQMNIRHKDYNANWIIQTPIQHQLLNLSVQYWEGAIDVVDKQSQNTLGYGFLEMTSY